MSLANKGSSGPRVHCDRRAVRPFRRGLWSPPQLVMVVKEGEVMVEMVEEVMMVVMETYGKRLKR